MASEGGLRFVWTVATRRWTRRQALIAAGCFAALGCVGLLVWPPLAFGGFMGAGSTLLAVVLGNTRR
jgi:hypothetical protein